METATSNENVGSPDSGKSNRGFASMSSERQKEIARKGGRAAHAKGTAHEFTTDEARAAGQKGGQRVSSNREHMSRIGRIGGKKSAGRRQETKFAGGSNSPDGGGPSGSLPGQEAAGPGERISDQQQSGAMNETSDQSEG